METAQTAQERRPSNPRKAPKSRNGCLRCKAKRLKCDERKPECYQCNRKHVACPGYKVKSFVWSTKHEKLSVADKNHPLPSTSESPPADSDKSISGKEKPEGSAGVGTLDLQVQYEAKSGESSRSSQPTIQTAIVGCRPRQDSKPCTDSLSAIRQQLHRSTVPEFLLHLPTMLVEYYFNYVCQIFSSFDSTLNPFRSTVGRLWDGSAPIYYAIQSMAAAYLSNHFPRMSPVGVQMQRETYRYLYQNQQGESPDTLDKTLLTVLLIGQTTAWHDPKDLGLVHLKTAKRLNRRRHEQQAGDVEGSTKRQNEFFEQCILYWDMLAGFVEDDVDGLGFDELEISTSPIASTESGTAMCSDTIENNFPHPWTGVAPKVQKLFAQVGRLIRNYRKIFAQDVASFEFFSFDFDFETEFPQESAAAIEATAKAQSLEEELILFEPPSVTSLVDAGDENTPVQQYILLAEAYRCAALLQIYRVFPSIFLRRVPVIEESLLSGSAMPENNVSHHLFQLMHRASAQSPDEFLVSLALHVISLLEKLPPTSGTRCLQPIVIIAAASELRFSPPMSSDPMAPFMPASSASIFNSITNREVDIADARRFVVTRLQEFQLSLPAKPIVKALQLIQETWMRADLGQEAFWMDVMGAMGLETIYG